MVTDLEEYKSISVGLVRLIEKGYSGYETYNIYETFENRYIIKHYKEYLKAYKGECVLEYIIKKNKVWDRYTKLKRDKN